MFAMCAGGTDSIPGADKLDSGFHPSGVGKMSSNWYVVGWSLQNTVELKRPAVQTNFNPNTNHNHNLSLKKILTPTQNQMKGPFRRTEIQQADSLFRVILNFSDV